MTSLSRRLMRLEANCRQNDAISADRRRLVAQRAFQHLSTDELRCLRAAKVAGIEGRSLADQELRAVKAFEVAVEVERQRIGMDATQVKTVDNRQATRP